LGVEAAEQRILASASVWLAEGIFEVVILNVKIQQLLILKLQYFFRYLAVKIFDILTYYFFTI
jgi:hypothetical protein